MNHFPPYPTESGAPRISSGGISSGGISRGEDVARGPGESQPSRPAQWGYQLKNLQIRPGLVLAPMSGVTCMSFRCLIRELNPDALGLVMTEFISVEALTRQIKRSLDMMRFKESERLIAIQIFGYDPGRMRDAALMAQDAGADVVDINCGCPAPKVVRKGGGCELMRQPLHLGRMVKEVRAAVSVPLTLKMRSGWDVHSVNCIEVAHICESEGIDALAVHGRTRTQMYRGDADWDLIWKVSDAVSIPVLGSGDVVDAATFEARMRRPLREGAVCSPATPPSDAESARDRPKGLAGVMIGRGALANPLVFSEIAKGRVARVRGDEQKAVAIMSRYAELLSEEFPPKVRVGKIKQLGSQMLRGFTWRKELLLAQTFEAQDEILRALRAGTYSPGRRGTGPESSSASVNIPSREWSSEEASTDMPELDSVSSAPGSVSPEGVSSVPQ